MIKSKTAKEAWIPPGWKYNPSASSKRLPLLIAGACGFVIALYLGLYQAGVFGTVWEPFFGRGTTEILNSSLARSLPVPDALLGAFAYLVEIIAGSIGGQDRWHNKPWAVLLFGLIVTLMALVSLALLILQPMVIHHWCTLCICSALISLFIISPVSAELLATLQFLKYADDSESVHKLIWGKGARQTG